MEPMSSSATAEASLPSEMDLSNPNFAKEFGYAQVLPDLEALFSIVNQKLFDNRIDLRYVKYSRYLQNAIGFTTIKAKNPLGIRISWPVMRVRPLYDLMDAILHESIHALLESLDLKDENDHHGQHFLNQIERIKKETNYNIKVDLTFEKDDRERQISYYRCDGECRTLPPFFGIARGEEIFNTTIPSEHSKICEGKFTKIVYCGFVPIIPEHLFDEKSKINKEELADINCFLCEESVFNGTDLRAHWNTCLENFPAADEGTFLERHMERDVDKTIPLPDYVPYACPLCHDCFSKEEMLEHLEAVE